MANILKSPRPNLAKGGELCDVFVADFVFYGRSGQLLHQKEKVPGESIKPIHQA